MFDAQISLPVADTQGSIFTEEHHTQFLAYVATIFIGSGFLPPKPGFRILLVRGEGGLIANSADLRGLINVAKAIYRVGAIRLEYLGEIELL